MVTHVHCGFEIDADECLNTPDMPCYQATQARKELGMPDPYLARDPRVTAKLLSVALHFPLALTSPHAHGQLVKDAQWLLAGHGPKYKHPFYKGKIDGEYGKGTAEAAKEAKFFLGYTKGSINSTFGQKLYDYLDGKKRLGPFMLIRRKRRIAAAVKATASGGLNKKALALAAKYVGVTEHPAGSNDNMFGAWYGVNGQPWCAIFVSYVLVHVGHGFRYSYVPNIVYDGQRGRNHLRAIPFSAVQAALNAGHPVLACFDWPGESPGTADHVGFVTHVIDGSSFNTIEGNTSLDNNSNGGEVMQRTRYRNTVQAFVEVLG